MKILNTLFVILLAHLIFISCDVHEKTEDTENAVKEAAYDSIKAQKYGADDYGMKKYVMAFLKRGPNKELDKDSAMKLQMAHLENIGKMAEAGKLVLAGPFMGDQDLRGIYIFNVESIIEAEELTNTDPAIRAGILEMELMEWYGSAALLDVNQIHNTLAKKGIIEE
jgi:uncharacterized protein YciI